MTEPTQAQIEADNQRLRSALADMVEITKRNSSPEIILTAIRTCAAHALTAAAQVGEPDDDPPYIAPPKARTTFHAPATVNATIERCAQVAEKTDPPADVRNAKIAAAIRKLKDDTPEKSA